MPPERQPTQKRRRLPFNPPSRASTSAGPSTTATSSKSKTKPTAKSTTKRKSNAVASSSKSIARRQSPSPSESAASDSTSRSGSDAGSTASRDSVPLEEPDFILAEITHNNQVEDVVSSEPAIPQKLLTRLLHQHFRNQKTKIAKDANAVVAKYTDVYVREAVARAAYERAETGGGGIADGFLEVEDLEKMGPQLAMDF